MGNTIYHVISPHSFLMGMLWFNIFVLLGLVMRKLRFPIKFSVLPLLLLLILTMLRMIIIVERPNSIIIPSDTIYPAVFSFMRFEFTQISGVSVSVVNVLISLWAAVATILIMRHLVGLTLRAFQVYSKIKQMPRDEYAESLLTDIIGKDKYVRVFRSYPKDIPFSTIIKPYIVLPKLNLSDDVLRVTLLHEWKHILDKDALTENIIDIICYVFWWNPFVYILQRNFSFVRELKCDYYAVSSAKDFMSYMNTLKELNIFAEQKNVVHETNGIISFISDMDEEIDRIKMLLLRRGGSRRKQLSTNIVFSTIIGVLFVASYLFLIQPVFLESPDVSVDAGVFAGEHDIGEIFRIEEIYIMDNGNNLFSLYFDGQFVKHVDETSELLMFIPIYKMER